mmetsp:Transcript_14389/g.34036  ORF Transcript_14389/g.34036 Transcript_14389/m.34036 type:complete len:107 (+) Transcript_14389:2-322(+)
MHTGDRGLITTGDRAVSPGASGGAVFRRLTPGGAGPEGAGSEGGGEPRRDVVFGLVEGDLPPGEGDEHAEGQVPCATFVASGAIRNWLAAAADSAANPAADPSTGS